MGEEFTTFNFNFIGKFSSPLLNAISADSKATKINIYDLENELNAILDTIKENDPRDADFVLSRIDELTKIISPYTNQDSNLNHLIALLKKTFNEGRNIQQTLSNEGVSSSGLMTKRMMKVIDQKKYVGAIIKII